LVAAAHAEVSERTAGYDFAVGQHTLKPGDDARKEINIIAAPSPRPVPAHLSEGFLNDLVPGHFGIDAVLAVLHRGRENILFSQERPDKFAFGHSTVPHTVTAD
jgi:hypothetical protein